MENKGLLIGGIIVVLVVAYLYMQNSSGSSKSKSEGFTYDQIRDNAKNYTLIPRKSAGKPIHPDFMSICGAATTGRQLPVELQGMTDEQIKSEIDLHYKKPMEMPDTADLLPEADLSGLSYGADPAEDFANKFVWHRTTHARLKRRNWEGGAAMIRGDLIIDPGKQSWFQHDNDYRDLTPGFIPKQICGEIDVEDLSYNLHVTH